MALMKFIILYTSPTAHLAGGSIEFFAEHEVPHQELDVSEVYDARDDLEEAHGSHDTTTLVIDGEAVIGFRREELARRRGPHSAAARVPG